MTPEAGYPRETKNSGIHWVGSIPFQWKVGRIKHGYNVVLGKMISPEQTDEFQTLENYLCAANIKQAGIDTSVKKQMWFTQREKDQYLLVDGNLLIMEGGNAGTPCMYKGEFAPCYIQNSVHKLDARELGFNKYLYYFMIIVRESGYIDDICNKSTILHYTKEKVEGTPCLYPPVEEQAAIVSFLDARCSKIDEAVSRHKQIIEKLEEYRKSVITQAVTKGLDPNAEMKDSGIRWARVIPAHWAEEKLKFVTTITNGTDPKTEGTIPVYGSGASSFKTCGEYKEGPTVLIGRKGATLNIPHYIPHRYWNVDTAFDCHMNDGNDLRWFYYVATCLDYKYYMTQTTLPSMTQTDYGNMTLPVPSISEQKQIAKYLDQQTDLIENAITRQQGAISKLEEYRKSLIYNAVTGKIDCRKEA